MDNKTVQAIKEYVYTQLGVDMNTRRYDIFDVMATLNKKDQEINKLRKKVDTLMRDK